MKASLKGREERHSGGEEEGHHVKEGKEPATWKEGEPRPYPTIPCLETRRRQGRWGNRGKGKEEASACQGRQCGIYHSGKGGNQAGRHSSMVRDVNSPAGVW